MTNAYNHDLLFERVAIALEMCSEAPSAMGWTREDAVAVSSPSRDVSIVSGPEARTEYYRRRYAGCNTDNERRMVIGTALDELRDIRYAKRPKVDASTREGRLAIGRDKRPASVVAYVYGYTVRHIHNLRRAAREDDARQSVR